MSAITARGLAFALDFISAEVAPASLSPEADAQLREVREALPDLKAFVAERWKRITPEIEAVQTAVVSCSSCGEQAAVIDEGVRCHFCGHRVDGGETAAEEYGWEVLGASQYEAVKGGDNWIVSMCPSCENEALVDGYDSGHVQPDARWVCFSCAEYWTERQLWPCDYCGTLISAADGEITVCSSCFDARMDAMD